MRDRPATWTEEQPTRFDLRRRSRPIDQRSIETSMRRLTSNDRNGAISYWIFENKISTFKKLQDLSNGTFAVKIGLEMISNEVRKTT